jgi:GTP-binding protein HflX
VTRHGNDPTIVDHSTPEGKRHSPKVWQKKQTDTKVAEYGVTCPPRWPNHDRLTLAHSVSWNSRTFLSESLSMIEMQKPSWGKAVVVGIQLPENDEADYLGSVAELERLVHTLGFQVVATLHQKRKALHPGTAIGEGKLEELARFTLASDEHPEPTASVVIFDCELTPNQMQNLERATGAEVMDRTGVIVEIFSRHAQTREAKLQVEIAKLNYLAPRLRASRVGGDRQGGGIGGKGAGESAHELDKRRIRDRIAELRRQLAAIAENYEARRNRRTESRRVALVGYTNAGKSSLMRALTGSEVLVADKLFATLDTTVRALVPPAVPSILISDTVGFIKKLPHDLVASFRSTLDEAAGASLLLYVVDASDPTFRAQLEVTREVLADIGADDVPSQLVLNKIDRVDAAQLQALRAEFPDAIAISTRRPDDVKLMRQAIIAFFEQGMREELVVIPHAQLSVMGKVRALARVIAENYEEDGAHLKLMVSEATLRQIKSLLS